MVNKSPFAIVASSESPSPAIERILQKCSRSSSQEPDAQALPILQEKHGWSSNFYRLDRSTQFASLSEEKQNAILLDCSRKNIEEALMIEIAGMSYTAKMSLLSDSIEQRELYSHFAADEANHYRAIRAIVGTPKMEMVDQNPFLRHLGLMIQDETKSSLVLLIQVILEGWGIPYYTRLANESRLPEVSQVLHKIVADEAKHHGSGLLLFFENKLSSDELSRVQDRLTELLTLLRLGPAGVAASLSRELGGMNEQDLIRFLEETSSQDKLKSDLELIQFLLKKVGAFKTLEKLSQKGLFELVGISDCASQLASFMRSAA